MKPFKYKNKVSFGDFKSAMEAARAVDAAFYYYDKKKWRNFRDSLAYLPPLPGALTEEGKLKFVKEQARLLACYALQMASTYDPANRCEDLKSSTHQAASSTRLVQPIESTGSTQAGHSDGAIIPATDLRDHSQAIQVDPSLDGGQTALFQPIQPLEEAVIREDTLALALVDDDDDDDDDDSQSTASHIHPLTRTLCASTLTILETLPEIPDDDDLSCRNPIGPDNLEFSDEFFWEEHKALDVNEYMDMIQVLIVEPDPDQGSA